MSTIFTQIIAGRIPCHQILENESFFAFLDTRPIHPGHVLIVPKEETDYFFDLGDAHLSGILPFAQPIAKAIETVVPCKRVAILVAGVEVPHAHLHLIPFTDMRDIHVDKAKKATTKELTAMAKKIRGAL
jgi:histidine triad (HIT) family protein